MERNVLMEMSRDELNRRAEEADPQDQLQSHSGLAGEVSGGRGGGSSASGSTQSDQDVVIDIPHKEKGQEQIPQEPCKTIAALIFFLGGALSAAVSLAATHDRLPATAPLPDIVHEHVSYQKWGLDWCEYLLILSTLTAISVVLLHQHRFIVIRRIFLLLGILYYYRSLCFWVTVVPKADIHYHCNNRSDDVSMTEYVRRVVGITIGGGLSINGMHVYCGDYIFSGHTVALTMGYLVIKQYSPRGFKFLHWASFLVSVCGTIFLLIGRGHYTIDILLAYFLTTRLWWVYHTLAHSSSLRTRGEHNLIANECWWYAFRWFEAKTDGPLPRRYSIPLPESVKKFIVRKCNSCQGEKTG